MSTPTPNPDNPAPPASETVPGAGSLYATLHTSMGDITARLYEREAPRTVAHFVALALGRTEWTDPKTREATTRPLYSGTIFHRVIPEFMIQGGCPLGLGSGNPGYRWGDEIHPSLRHDRPGVLSMANSGPNTNGSQFFITEVPTPWLDGKHAIFGEVVEGLELVPAITHVPTGPRNKPMDDIVLHEIRVFRR